MNDTRSAAVSYVFAIVLVTAATVFAVSGIKACSTQQIATRTAERLELEACMAQCGPNSPVRVRNTGYYGHTCECRP